MKLKTKKQVAEGHLTAHDCTCFPANCSKTQANPPGSPSGSSITLHCSTLLFVKYLWGPVGFKSCGVDTWYSMIQLLQSLPSPETCSCSRLSQFSVWAGFPVALLAGELDERRNGGVLNHGKIMSNSHVSHPKCLTFRRLHEKIKNKIMIKDVVTRSQYCVGWVQHMFFGSSSRHFAEKTPNQRAASPRALHLAKRNKGYTLLPLLKKIKKINITTRSILPWLPHIPHFSFSWQKHQRRRINWLASDANVKHWPFH